MFTGMAAAQQLSFGAKGGALLTDPAERLDQSRRYVAGGVVEAEFASRIAVEGNALYQRFGAGSLRGDSWSFPVLGKYYTASRSAAIRPYVSGGVEFRRIWLDGGGRNRGRVGGFSGASNIGIGAVAAGGASLGAGRFRISPELRYTRWGGDNYPATNPHQLQVLVGVTF